MADLLDLSHLHRTIGRQENIIENARHISTLQLAFSKNKVTRPICNELALSLVTDLNIKTIEGLRNMLPGDSTTSELFESMAIDASIMSDIVDEIILNQDEDASVPSSNSPTEPMRLEVHLSINHAFD